MHGIAAASGAIVFVVSLVAPWDPGAGGGVGAGLALVVAVTAAITDGRLFARWRGVAAGAEVVFVALAAYALGTYIACELGLLGASWSAWGDSDHPPSLLLMSVILWGIPAAMLGGLLAALGQATRRAI